MCCIHITFFTQNLCFFWEAISHKTRNCQWRWDCQIFINEEKKLVEPWDQTIASRLIVRYNHLGSWLILNVCRHEHTHQVSTLHISRSSDLTVHRASCCDETPSSFWQEFVAVSLFHCTVFTPKAWAQILSYSLRHNSTCCLWEQLWLTDFDPHALVPWTLWHRNSSIAVVWADHDLRLCLLITGQNWRGRGNCLLFVRCNESRLNVCSKFKVWTLHIHSLTLNIFLRLNVANCSWMSENVLVYKEGEFWLSFYNMFFFFPSNFLRNFLYVVLSHLM